MAVGGDLPPEKSAGDPSSGSLVRLGSLILVAVLPFRDARLDQVPLKATFGVIQYGIAGPDHAAGWSLLVGYYTQ
jgi:hypothetical protein